MVPSTFRHSLRTHIRPPKRFELLRPRCRHFNSAADPHAGATDADDTAHHPDWMDLEVKVAAPSRPAPRRVQPSVQSHSQRPKSLHSNDPADSNACSATDEHRIANEATTSAQIQNHLSSVRRDKVVRSQAITPEVVHHPAVQWATKPEGCGEADADRAEHANTGDGLAEAAPRVKRAYRKRWPVGLDPFLSRQWELRSSMKSILTAIELTENAATSSAPEPKLEWDPLPPPTPSPPPLQDTEGATGSSSLSDLPYQEDPNISPALVKQIDDTEPPPVPPSPDLLGGTTLPGTEGLGSPKEETVATDMATRKPRAKKRPSTEMPFAYSQYELRSTLKSILAAIDQAEGRSSDSKPSPPLPPPLQPPSSSKTAPTALVQVVSGCSRH